MRIEVKRLLLPLQLSLLLCRSTYAVMKKQMVADEAQEETCVVGNDGQCLNVPLVTDSSGLMEVPYGQKQSAVGETADQVKERLKEIQKYMYETVYPTMKELGPHCKLNHQGSFAER
jgi:hypothetical protein